MKNTEVKSEKIKLVFVGIDDWNRPVFKIPDTSTFFGSTDVLLGFEDVKKDRLNDIKLEDLCYFGSSFNCEPMGGIYLHEGKIIKMNSGRFIEPALGDYSFEVLKNAI